MQDWQKRLRAEIRSRCQGFESSADQVLHATFRGAKLHNADVENLLFYNVSSFAAAGRNGIRFEYGAAVPPAPSGAEYPFSYCYALAPRSGVFADWQRGRTLASFDWTDLGAFAGEKKLAQVWLALARGGVEVATPGFALGTPYAVRVQVRPPSGRHPVWGELVKKIFDGVICACQGHTETVGLPDVVESLAAVLRADPAEIDRHLRDRSRAVLCASRLVYPYRNGVKWEPADHWCVAGELLASEPVGRHWAIRGELVELSR